MFRRKPLGERLAEETHKLIKRDLRMGPELTDRQVQAVSWNLEWDLDDKRQICDVTIRFGPRRGLVNPGSLEG